MVGIIRKTVRDLGNTVANRGVVVGLRIGNAPAKGQPQDLSLPRHLCWTEESDMDASRHEEQPAYTAGNSYAWRAGRLGRLAGVLLSCRFAIFAKRAIQSGWRQTRIPPKGIVQTARKRTAFLQMISNFGRTLTHTRSMTGLEMATGGI